MNFKSITVAMLTVILAFGVFTVSAFASTSPNPVWTWASARNSASVSFDPTWYSNETEGVTALRIDGISGAGNISCGDSSCNIMFQNILSYGTHTIELDWFMLDGTTYTMSDTHTYSAPTVTCGG